MSLGILGPPPTTDEPPPGVARRAVFRGSLAAGCLALVAIVPAFSQGETGEIDVSQCDNCKDFPAEWLEVEASELLDLGALAPERRLDFLVGEWELLFPYTSEEQGFHFTRDRPIGYETYEWFVPGKILQAFQEWLPFTTSEGRPPFRAKTDFRYVAAEDRWQMTWLTVGASGVFTGGLEDGALAFYEHEFTGGRRKLELREGMRYVLRNITRDSFLAEEYRSADGGETWNVLKWRVLYRRRTSG